MTFVLAEAQGLAISLEATAIAGFVSVSAVGLIAWLVKQLLALSAARIDEKFEELSKKITQTDTNSEGRHHRLRGDLNTLTTEVGNIHLEITERLVRLEAVRDAPDSNPGKRRTA